MDSDKLRYGHWAMKEQLLLSVRRRVALHVKGLGEIEESRLKMFIRGQMTTLTNTEEAAKGIIDSLVSSGAFTRSLHKIGPVMIYSNFED